jgi:hypothetical protein
VSLPEIAGVNYTAGDAGAIDEKIWLPEHWARTSLTGQVVPWEAGDYPVAGNWDFGPDGVVIWRPSAGEFRLRMDNGNLVTTSWGNSRCRTVPVIPPPDGCAALGPGAVCVPGAALPANQAHEAGRAC